MDKERKLIDYFKRDVFSSENICYFATDLISEDYDPVKLAEYARQEGLGQRLGYLAEVCAQVTEVTHLDEESNKLKKLYGALESQVGGWKHLSPNGPEWGKRIDMYGDMQTETNKKWRVYSPLRLEEVEDFVDLYVTKDYLNFTLWERNEMRDRGVKYTRLIRSGSGREETV